jgi:hypothetical protein
MRRSLRQVWPWVLALAGAGLVAGVWAMGLAAVPLTVRANVLYHTEPIGEIRGDQTVGQSVRTPYDGLYRVDVSLADYGRENAGPVTFRVWSAPPEDSAATILVEQQFEAETIQGDVMYSLEFAPLVDTSGRELYFELSAPAGQPGQSLTAYWQPTAPYLAGTAYVAGAPVQGDLVFVLHFQVAGRERLNIGLQQMTADKPRPLGWAGFAIGLAALYVVMAAALAWAIPRFGV